VEVTCGQGPAPTAAGIQRIRKMGLGEVPGTGLIAACVPGAFAAWLALLRDHGTWRLADVLEFAIGYAESGYPLLPRIADTLVLVELMDSSGVAHPGLLTAADLAALQARREEPVTADFRGWTVAKCGPWSQGPVFLQQLQLLAPYDLASTGFLSADHIHLVTECAKL